MGPTGRIVIARSLAGVIAAFAVVSGCQSGDSTCPCSSNPRKPIWTLHPDSMNLAVLVVDYLDYDFEECALDYYPPCDACDKDSLPFDVIFNPPGDFGDITFAYTETGDTLFHGSIIWIGMGAIGYPDVFLPDTRFGKLESGARDPISVQYYNVYPTMDQSEFEARADTAWANVERLDIVWDFAMGEYRVGIYLYPPSVGVFDPNSAKWIVFLYRGRSD